MNAPAPVRLIRFPEVQRRVSLGKVALWRLRREGRFPQPVRLGSRIAFIESEVEAWIEERIRERDQRLAAR
jgi:prophage regulatory protein